MSPDELKRMKRFWQQDVARGGYEQPGRDGLALVEEVKRLGLAEKTWRGRAETNAADRDTAQSALEAAQARERVLREALGDVVQIDKGFTRVDAGQPRPRFDRIVAALATPVGDSALREFGLRVLAAARPPYEDDGELVDAVLRGER